MPRRATIESIARWLVQRDNIVLIGHVKPDGDAVGSCMAAMLALEALGKRCFVYLSDGVPAMLRRYPYADRVVSSGQTLPFAPETAFSLDVSDEERLGDGRALFDAAVHRVMLDHHATNPGFGDLWHVEGDRCATGELVQELIEALGVTLTREMATWLFVAVSTDSGHFRFSSVTEKTLLCASRLLEAGVDWAGISRELWNTRTLSRTRLLGAVLSHLEISDDGRMTWSKVTRAMLEECGATGEDTEGIISYLLEIEGVEFAFLAEEIEDGVKFSLRSKERLDVAGTLARPFGGGGHPHAAGCTLHTDMDSAVLRMRAAGAEALRALEDRTDA